MSARLLSLCLSAAVAITALVVGVAVVVAPVDAEPTPAADPAPTEVVAAALLRQWDVRRARAWAIGDPTALRDLYTAGSSTGGEDRAMLRSWTRRGMRVEGLRMQLLAIEVRTWSDDRVVLAVTDRLAGGVATGPGVRVPLPRDAASTRTVALRKVTGEWRVASVLGQARPVRTTSWTVRSRNP